MKKKTTMTVTDIRRLAEAVFSMKLRYPEGDLPEEVKPGQFAGLYPNDPSKLLPRPISICRWDPDTGELQFVFRVARFDATRVHNENVMETCVAVKRLLGS